MRRVVPTVPAAAMVEKVDARVGDGDTPLGATSASCLALAPNGKTLLIGLPDGGVAIADGAKRAVDKTVRLPQNAPPTRQVVATDNGKTVWWLSGSTGDTVYAWRVGDDKLTAYHVNGADTTGWVRRLGVLHGRVVLIGDGVSRLLDAKSGALEPMGDTLPGGAITFADGGPAPLQVTDNGGKTGALLVAEAPDGSSGSVMLWRGGDNREQTEWTPAGALSLSAANRSGAGDALTASCAVTGNSLAIAQTDGVRVYLPGTDKNDAPLADTLAPFGDEPGRPAQADTVALGDSGVWWTAKGVLFRADAHDASRGATDAFLPWNGASAVVSSLVADDNGAWVATATGVRRVRLEGPDEETGYDGYVRVRLGDKYAAVPDDPTARKVADAVEAWQGTKYVYGGMSKKGVDCSGFVGLVHQAAGVTIPRSSSEMAQTNTAPRVRDELRYGDVLVYPGHVALYIGNGRTAETVTKLGVSKASVWRRREVVVRRFLR